MRKFLFVISILLVVLALGGPWLIGQQIEKTTLGSEQDLATSLPPWAELVDVEFKRGWFGSASRYHIVLTEDAPPAVRQLIGNFAGFGDQPALIVNNGIQHGPLIGLFTPAAAEINSDFAVDNGNGEVTTLPLLTQTRIGLTGALGLNWKMGGLSLKQPEGGVTAGESSGKLKVSSDQRRIALELIADALTISRRGQTVLSLESVVSENTLEIGSTETTLDSTYRYDDTFDTLARRAISGDIGVRGIASEALPGALALLGKIQSDKPNNTELQALLQASLPTLVGLLAETPVVEWRQQLDQSAGETFSDVKLTLAPQSGPMNYQSYVEQLIADMLVTVDFSAPIELVESGTSRNALLTNALAMGMLEKDKDAGLYRMDLDYENGEATVNGLPLPLGMQR
ncbi:MAG: DUF945 family protein [Pseudomonadota bacterium]